MIKWDNEKEKNVTIWILKKLLKKSYDFRKIFDAFDFPYDFFNAYHVVSFTI